MKHKVIFAVLALFSSLSFAHGHDDHDDDAVQVEQTQETTEQQPTEKPQEHNCDDAVITVADDDQTE